jgi:hypothetical protein
MFQTQFVSWVFRIVTFGLFTLYITIYIANLGVLFAANSPIFETCDMYEDSNGCFTRYIFYLTTYCIFGIGATLYGMGTSKCMTQFSAICRFGLIAILITICAYSFVAGEPIMEL